MPVSETTTSTTAVREAPPYLVEVLDELRGDTRELLRAIKDATPAMRRLVLGSAPFGIRSELLTYGLCRDGDGDSGERLVITALGEAALEALKPLNDDERQQLAERAQRALEQ